MSAAAEQVRVRSVEELASLLNHADFAYRVAAYSSIATDSKKALQLEKHDGNDILDILIERLNDSQPRSERLAILATIGEFEDSRAADAFRAVLLGAADDEILHAAARFICDHKIPIDSRALLQLLRDSDRASRVRIAAELMSDSCAADSRDWIRMATFAPHKHQFPPVNDETIRGWLSELSDVYGEYIRLMLERHQTGLSQWVEYWDTLDIETRIWLARRACYSAPVNNEIIQLALNNTDRIQTITRDSLNLYGVDLNSTTSKDCNRI